MPTEVPKPSPANVPSEKKKVEEKIVENSSSKKSIATDGDKPRFAFTEETLSKKFELPDLNNLDNPTVDENSDEPVLKIKENIKLTRSRINNVWTKYVTQLETEGKTSAEMLFKDRDIEIHAEQEFIVIHFENRVQLDNFEELKTDLLFFLRQNLSNANVKITAEVKAHTSDAKRLYTDKDKLAYLIEQRPIVQDLKNRLGLDAEY